MNKRVIYGIIIVVILLIGLLECRSCNSSFNSNQEEQAEDEQTEESYEDGTYCADVDYYNPNTGTRNQYVLEVEVENNEVVKINFGNGGWLDSDHMTPETLDENGECTITSDRNYEYGIKITGQDCGYTDSIDEEEDPEIWYSVSDCAAQYDMTQKEIKDCIRALNLDKDELLNEEQCQVIGNYIAEVREEMARWGPIQKEIDEGYIQGVYHYEMRDIVYCHQVMVLKYGTYYWLEVRGSRKCSTGTMKFNENSSVWQTVPVKYSPSSTTISIHEMRMMGESSSKSELDSRIRNYCNEQF